MFSPYQQIYPSPCLATLFVFFLSKEFLNDLEKSNGDEIVKKYGTHVSYRCTLGGDIPLFLMLLNIAICYLMWI